MFVTFIEECKVIPKGWGVERIIASNNRYAAKLLEFTAEGKKSSMHFHKEKMETWLIMSGKFRITVIDTHNATRDVASLGQGAIITLLPMVPHQIECIEAGVIIEVSSPDSYEDNYRVEKGDSQNAKTKNDCV